MSPSPSRDSPSKRSSGRISIGQLFRRSTSGSPARESQSPRAQSPSEEHTTRRQSRPLSPTSDDEDKPGSPSSILATLASSSSNQPHRYSMEIPSSHPPPEGDSPSRPLSSPTSLGFTHDHLISTVDVGGISRDDPSSNGFLLRSRSRHRSSTSPPNDRALSHPREGATFNPETASEEELRQFCRHTLQSSSKVDRRVGHPHEPSSILLGSSNSSSMDSELHETIARVAELKDALQAAETRLQEKDAQLQRVQGEHAKEVARLDKDMALLSESAREVGEMAEMWEKRAKEANATCQELCGKAEETEAQHADLQARIEELQESLVEAETRVNQVRAEQDGPSMEDLKGRIQELEDALLGGEDEDERKDEEARELRQERDAVERALEETEGRMIRAQKETTTLRAEVNRLTDIVRNDAQASAKSTGTGTAERRIQDLEREVTDLRESVLASEELEQEWKERYRELTDLYEAEIAKANAIKPGIEMAEGGTIEKQHQLPILWDLYTTDDKDSESTTKKEDETEEDWQIQIHLDPTDTDTSKSMADGKGLVLTEGSELNEQDEHELIRKIRTLEREKRMLTERTIILSQKLTRCAEPLGRNGGGRGTPTRKSPHFSVYRGPSQASRASATSPVLGATPASPRLEVEDKGLDETNSSSILSSSSPYVGNLEKWRMQIQSIREAADQERARAQKEAEQERELRSKLEEEGAALSAQLRDLYLTLEEREEEIRDLEDRLSQRPAPIPTQEPKKRHSPGKHRRAVSFERVVLEQEAEREKRAGEEIRDEEEEESRRDTQEEGDEEYWKEREKDMEHQVRVARMERDAAIVEGDGRWEELAQAYTRVGKRCKSHRALGQRLQTALGQMIAHVDANGGDLEGEWLDVLQSAEQELGEEEEEGEEEDESFDSRAILGKRRGDFGKRSEEDQDNAEEDHALRSHWLKDLVEDEGDANTRGETDQVKDEDDASINGYSAVKPAIRMEDEASSTLEGDWEGLTRQLGQAREEKDDAVMALERARLLTGRQKRQLSRMEEQLREREAALRVAEEMAGVMREELVRKEREMGEYRRRDGSNTSSTSLAHPHHHHRISRRISVSGLLGERPSLTDGSLLFTEDMHTLLRQNAETLGCLDELCDMAATAISQVNAPVKASPSTYRSNMSRRSISSLLAGGGPDEMVGVKDGALIRDGRMTLDIAQRMIDGVRNFGEEVQEVMETYVSLVEQERAQVSREGEETAGDPEWMIVGEIWLRVTSQYLLRAESWVSEMLGMATSPGPSSPNSSRHLEMRGSDASLGSLGGSKADRRRQQQLMEEKEGLQGVIQDLESEVGWLREQQGQRQARDKERERALVQEVRYQRAKARREAGFRADLGFQKRYFLLMIGGLEMGETGTLRMISEMAPTTSSLEGGGDGSRRILSPAPTLRAVILMVMAVMRLRRLAGDWGRVRALKYTGGSGAQITGPPSSRERLSRPLSPGASTISGRSRESRGRRHKTVGTGYGGSVSAYRKL
ncbi:hypothetical protein BJ684DRAFT_20083 [Piptocephalis cylindrospora]|uniref:Pericentrin/AKAP-450 centrosomal targeting domain-containing protein n=1 Tax=Piptocephalis cylindrospora TaxID=1907219 RepID=A0A4P9Y3I3_9FUNG|nr:hypothetical protein BJ684DRAFT_20083 [Piptocephalis cylindrospora]|eukprot:RKP13425.1 hypothetical protein BJ684DRAFT_20083 [Piptocephalis cylindrospora]